MGACTSRTKEPTPLASGRNASLQRSISTLSESGKPIVGKCDYVIVCCGAPQQGMGWYHATQLLNNRCPSAQLVEVVEPYLLADGRDTPDGRAFASWAQAVPDVKFLASVSDISKPKPGDVKVALLAPRVADASRLFIRLLKTGVTHVLIERPGAPNGTVLEAMAAAAAQLGVPVCMSYPKNAAPYVSSAIQCEKILGSTPSAVTFTHCDDFRREEFLQHARERLPGGCLAASACHELMLLVSFYNLRRQEVNDGSVVVDLQKTERVTDGITMDYTKLAFEIHTRRSRGSSGRYDTLCTPTNEDQPVRPWEPAVFRVELDRCAGGLSTVSLKTRSEACSSREEYTEEVLSAQMPDQKHAAEIPKLMQQMPGLKGHQYQQDQEYASMKEQLATHALSQLTGLPQQASSIRSAVEVMAITELLSTIVDAQVPITDEQYHAGVYRVVLEGGVRYRNSPNFEDVDYEQQMALYGTDFEIREFVTGSDGVLYAYLWWARYFLPVRHPTLYKNSENGPGVPILCYVGPHGASPQLEQLALDIFALMDRDGDKGLSWDEVVGFLQSAGIAFDLEKLSCEFEKAASRNNRKQLDFDEFVAAYQNRAISDIWCIPTSDRHKFAHPPEAYQCATGSMGGPKSRSRASTSGRRASTSGQRASTNGRRGSTSGRRASISGQRASTSGRRASISGQRASSRSVNSRPQLFSRSNSQL